MANFQDVSQERKQSWIEAEDKFFGGLPTEQPELYQKAVQLVRALADALEDVLSPKELESAFEKRDEDWARDRAEAINIGIPRRINIPQARRAAFQLRYNEVRPGFLNLLSTLSSIDPDADEWHVLLEQEGEFTGRSYCRRLHLHTPDAQAIFLHPFLNPEGRYVHVIEGLVLDLETGERTGDEPVLSEPRQFDSREEALESLQELRTSIDL